LTWGNVIHHSSDGVNDSGDSVIDRHDVNLSVIGDLIDMR
jgi:hypothetical protein